MEAKLLNYYQDVLDKISKADAPTFRKEMRKAFKRLVPTEREAMKQWFRSACLCRIPDRDLQPSSVPSNGPDQLK